MLYYRKNPFSHFESHGDTVKLLNSDQGEHIILNQVDSKRNLKENLSALDELKYTSWNGENPQETKRFLELILANQKRLDYLHPTVFGTQPMKGWTETSYSETFEGKCFDIIISYPEKFKEVQIFRDFFAEDTIVLYGRIRDITTVPYLHEGEKEGIKDDIKIYLDFEQTDRNYWFTFGRKSEVKKSFCIFDEAFYSNVKEFGVYRIEHPVNHNYYQRKD